METSAAETTTASMPVRNGSDEAAGVAIRIQDLTVAYHRKPVLWDIDLTIPEGQLIAVVGPTAREKAP